MYKGKAKKPVFTGRTKVMVKDGTKVPGKLAAFLQAKNLRYKVLPGDGKDIPAGHKGIKALIEQGVGVPFDEYRDHVTEHLAAAKANHGG